MKMRLRFEEVVGGHVRVSVFIGKSFDQTLAKAGEITLGLEEAKALEGTVGHVEVAVVSDKTRFLMGDGAEPAFVPKLVPHDLGADRVRPVLDVLEKKLADAKDGRVRSVAVATVNKDGGLSTVYHIDETDRYALHFAVATTGRRLLNGEDEYDPR